MASLPKPLLQGNLVSIPLAFNRPATLLIIALLYLEPSWRFSQLPGCKMSQWSSERASGKPCLQQERTLQSSLYSCLYCSYFKCCNPFQNTISVASLSPNFLLQCTEPNFVTRCFKQQITFKGQLFWDQCQGPDSSRGIGMSNDFLWVLQSPVSTGQT